VTIHITREAVYAKGLAALNAKRLSAQGPTPTCAYRDASGCPCIIGTVLSERDAAALEVESVDSAYESHLVSFDADVSLFQQLQLAHDFWAAVEDARKEGRNYLLCSGTSFGIGEGWSTAIKVKIERTAVYEGRFRQLLEAFKRAKS
jgi:hypothetical protein